MSPETSEIRDGIEWYRFRRPDGWEEEDCQCARCGSSAYHVRCWNCGGDGTVEHASWDGCGPDYDVRCDWCQGRGGSWRCISGREWCEAHPIPGREDVKSTANADGERYDEW